MTHALLYFACFDTIEAVKIMSKSMQIKKITHYVKKQMTNTQFLIECQSKCRSPDRPTYLYSPYLESKESE